MLSGAIGLPQRARARQSRAGMRAAPLTLPHLLTCQIVGTDQQVPGDLQAVLTAEVLEPEIDDRLAAVQVLRPVELSFQIGKP